MNRMLAPYVTPRPNPAFSHVSAMLMVLGLVILFARSTPAAVGAQPEAATQSLNYGRPCEPEVKTPFLPLPPGSVEPSGWLRDWAVAAREGITGHLDEHHPVFADGWKGHQVNAPCAEADGTGWPLEQCAYWLDGALRLGFVLHDEALIRKIRTRLDPVVEAGPAHTKVLLQ